MTTSPNSDVERYIRRVFFIRRWKPSSPLSKEFTDMALPALDKLPDGN
jgi:hypothetical protein